MTNRNRLYLLTAVVILLVLVASGVWAQTCTKELAKGVTLTQMITEPAKPDEAAAQTAGEAEDVEPPMVINVLKIAPKVPGVRVEVVLGLDRVHDDGPDKGRENVWSMVKRVGAIAAVNGDFYEWIGDPVGLFISEGELISEPHHLRTAFGITSDGEFLLDRMKFDAKVTLKNGKSYPIAGINRERGGGELVAYTSRYFSSTVTTEKGSESVVTTEDLPVRLGVPIKGIVTRARPDLGDTPIPEDAIVLSGSGGAGQFVEDKLTEGTEVTIEFGVKPSDTTGWEKVVEAIGGTPRLIRNGKISVEVEEEGLKPGFYDRTHPRTVVGMTAGGELLLVTVDGRQNISAGMKLVDLAELMHSLGCVEALNLDGGGSTTMATPAGMLNSPSSGILRAVATGLAVFADEKPVKVDPDVEPGLALLKGPIESGATAQVALLDALTGEPLSPELTDRVIWSANGGMGFVDQSGKFHAVKAYKGEIVVKLGSHIASIPAETIPGPASNLAATLEPDPAGAPNKSALAVSVTDLNSNGVGGQQVSVKVVGGTPDQADLTTDGNGKASTGIIWDAAPETTAEVSVTVGDLAPVIVQHPTLGASH